MSAPHSPGGASSVSARMSAATTRCAPPVAHRVCQRAIVADVAVGPRVLQQHAEGAGRGRCVGGAGDDLDAERFRARADDVARLREDVIRDEELRALAAAHPLAQRHRLGGCTRLVQHRRVGDRHPGEIAHHRLEVDERLEPALRYLGLVRRVRRVPRGILEDVAQDDAGRVRAVVALADERAQHAVLRRERGELRERLGLVQRRRQRKRYGTSNRRRHECVDHRRARRKAERRKHRLLVVGRRADVPRDEGVVIVLGRTGRAGSGSRVVHRRWPEKGCGATAARRVRRQASPSTASYAFASSSLPSAAGSAGFSRKNHAA